MRIAGIIILSLILVTISSIVPKPASASVQYDWEYNAVNLYNCYPIIYEFSSLDVSRANTWWLYTVDPSDGSLLQKLGFRQSIGSTTATEEFGGCSLDTTLTDDAILYPENYTGPLAIVDNNGTILGRHFVTNYPTYGDNLFSSDWFVNGNTTVNDKQVVGTDNVYGFCQNPVYAPLNVDGWQHTFKPCTVVTTVGDYAILHYQIDPLYSGPTTDRLLFFLIPDVTVQLTIYIDDIIDFQTTSGYSVPYASRPESWYSFIILNTDGQPLPFVNNQRAASTFTTGNNPTIASFDPGVYNYSRNNGGWISDGESVWIVSNDPNGQEWTLDAAVGQIGESGRQMLIARASSQGVWESYHGYQQVADSISGYSDTNIYAFSTARSHSYTVAGSATDDVTAQWINRASAINSGLATPAEMEFEVQAIFDISHQVTLEENLNTVIGNLGLDSDSGRAALLMIILFVGMLGVAAFTGLRGSVFSYLIVWTGLGSVYIIGGFGTDLVNTVYLIMTLGMWVFAIMSVTREDANG